MAGHQGASPAQLQVSLVVARIFHSKVVVEGLGLSRPDLRRHRARMRMRVGALENSEDKLVRASPARHLPVQLPVKREAEKKEGKAPMASRAGHQEVDRLLRLGRDKGNQRVERRKARKNHLVLFLDKTNTLLNKQRPRSDPGSLCLEAVRCRASVSDANQIREIQAFGTNALQKLDINCQLGVSQKRPTNCRRRARLQQFCNLHRV
jgi:hypothetical protein